MAKKKEVTTTAKFDLVSKLKTFSKDKRFYLVILILGILLLLIYKKSWIVAAIVNGEPIPTFTVNQKLNSLYKEKILTQIINEKILEQEARKQGIVISPQQIQEKVAEAETSYGGKETFEMLLSQQGLTRDEFLNQTRLQLLVEKLFEKESSPSAEEVQKFMTDNKSLPEATEEAKFKALAEDSVKNNKLSTIFSEKFQELRKNAKISIF